MLQAEHFVVFSSVDQCPSSVEERTRRRHGLNDANDPYVWSGRASQEVLVELVASGLASMYPAFDWSFDVLLAIMENSAHAISLADRPQRAKRVTSARMRREDRTSISSYPLADLGSEVDEGSGPPRSLFSFQGRGMDV